MLALISSNNPLMSKLVRKTPHEVNTHIQDVSTYLWYPARKHRLLTVEDAPSSLDRGHDAMRILAVPNQMRLPLFYHFPTSRSHLTIMNLHASFILLFKLALWLPQRCLSNLVTLIRLIILRNFLLVNFFIVLWVNGQSLPQTRQFWVLCPQTLHCHFYLISYCYPCHIT